MSQRNPLERLIGEISPRFERIESYLDHWASVRPSAIAVIDRSTRWTYRDLAEAVQQAAAGMAGRGVAAGDIVAVLAPPSLDFWVSFLASLRLDATWLGVNPKYTGGEIAGLVRDAQPKLLLMRERIGERDYMREVGRIGEAAAEAGCDVLPLTGPADGGVSPELMAGAPSFAPPSAPGNKVAALIYTSGTTGRPKAARLTHHSLARAGLIRSTVWHVGTLRTINNAPINHVGSLGDIACTSLIAGGSQVFLETFSAAATLACLANERVSYWYQAPTMFELCLRAPEAADMDWSGVEAAIWSGGRPSDDLVRRLGGVVPRLGVDYSMTESVGAITLAPLWPAAKAYDGGVGWPDPGRCIRIANADGVAVQPDMAGEVQLRDSWMFAGYRGDEGDDAFTPDGWFRTGDIAEVSKSGAWRLVGRSKEMFKSGGYNVYPREVETVIETHPAVLGCAVVEIPDPLYGEVGVAFVVMGDVEPETVLADFCRARLANYKVPKQFITLSALPMLPIGKIDRIALRARALKDNGIGKAM